MKNWWQELRKRDKQTLILGSIIVFFLLGYLCFWMPLRESILHLHEQIAAKRELLTWMQAVDLQIKNLPENLPSKTTGPFLTRIQNNIHQSEIASNLTEMRQMEHDAVKLHFKQVDFRLLMQWLTVNTEQQNWVVSRLMVKPSLTSGMVETELELAT